MNRSNVFAILILLVLISVSSFEPINAKPTFELKAQPTKQTIAPGMSTAYTIIVSSTEDFSSPVRLKVENEDDLPTSVSVLLYATTVTPPPNGIGYTILIVDTKKTTRTKDYEITISGVGEGTTKTVSVVLEVTKKSTFTISVKPFSKTISLDSSKEFEVTIYSLGKFDEEVEMNLEAAPYGMSYEFIPSTVTPKEGGSVVSTLKVYVSEDVDPNVYALIIEGSSEDEDRYSFVVVEVPEETEFELTLTPTEETVTIDKTVSFTVEAKSIGGFSSEIDLYLDGIPSGVTFSFDPESIKPTPTKTESSTLKLTVSTDAEKGDYDIDVKGSAQGIVKTVTIKLTINPIETELTVEVPLAKVRKGDSIAVKGEISESIEGATVKLIYTRPDGTEFTRTVKSDSEGYFTDSYDPDFTGLVPQAYIGMWRVRAEWEGSNAYTGSKSSVIDFEVMEVPFLEKYGLAFIYDYALWLAIILVMIIIIVAIALYYYRKTQPPKAVVEEKAPLALKEEKPPAIALKEEAVPPHLVERAVERIVEKPAEKVIERVVERPIKEIKRGRAPPLILPRKKCFNCGDVISAQAKFCDKCRAPQPKRVLKKYRAPSLILPRVYCTSCGAVISAKAKYCDKCRAPQKG